VRLHGCIPKSVSWGLICGLVLRTVLSVTQSAVEAAYVAFGAIQVNLTFTCRLLITALVS